ncbi:MAG: prepilin peptidase [Coriobacteriia bacterium]|nr:prepilin peptidase [Coriobacteriia bacterium]
MFVSSVYSFLGLGPTVFVLVLAFLLGAVFASFITCVADRLVAGESPWTGRSHCCACGHDLAPWDLIPVLSWLFARGRCRYCGAGIPVRCVVFEAALGVVFLLFFIRFGLSVPAVAYCALAVLLLGLSLVDLDTMTIPNGFVIAGIVVWLLQVVATAAIVLTGGEAMALSLGERPVILTASFFAGFGDLAALVLDGLVGGVCMGGGILAFSLLFDKITGKQSLGGGDVKLLFVVGLFLGLPLSLLNLIVSCVLGLVLAFGLKAKGKAFPFGPAIAAATVLTLLFGGPMMTWYLGLIF